MDDLLPRSSFVFEGVVREVKASTVKLVPAGDNTAVVRVARITKGADTVGDFTGDDITVVLQKPLSVRQGDRLVFFTNPKVSSKSLAVEETGHLALGEGEAPKNADELRERSAKVHRDTPTKRLQEHVAGADVVVAGRVTATKPVPRPQGAGPLTEHDPDWWEATIQVWAPRKVRHRPIAR